VVRPGDPERATRHPRAAGVLRHGGAGRGGGALHRGRLEGHRHGWGQDGAAACCLRCCCCQCWGIGAAAGAGMGALPPPRPPLLVLLLQGLGCESSTKQERILPFAWLAPSKHTGLLTQRLRRRQSPACPCTAGSCASGCPDFSSCSATWLSGDQAFASCQYSRLRVLLNAGNHTLLLWMGALPNPSPSCTLRYFGFCASTRAWTGSSGQLRLSSGGWCARPAAEGQGPGWPAATRRLSCCAACGGQRAECRAAELRMGAAARRHS
jgi:hypothetical protein